MRLLFKSMSWKASVDVILPNFINEGTNPRGRENTKGERWLGFSSWIRYQRYQRLMIKSVDCKLNYFDGLLQVAMGIGSG